jgi:hypothetical protein
MPITRFNRRDLVVRIRRAETGQDTVIEIGSERPVRRIVPGATLAGLTDGIPAADLALVLWNDAQIRGELERWQQTRAPGLWGLNPFGEEEQLIERLCLRVDDDRLIAFPLEQSLHHLLGEIGERQGPVLRIPRLMPVPPRVAQVPFSLPLRLLQLDSRGDFDLPATVRAVFGHNARGRGAASIMQVKADRAKRFAGWGLPPRWRTVDVLHLDQLLLSPDDRLLATSTPDRPGRSAGWCGAWISGAPALSSSAATALQTWRRCADSCTG